MAQKKVIFIILLIIFLLLIGSIIYLVIKLKLEKEAFQIPSKEKTLEEVLKDLTVPASGERSEVPEEVKKNLTAPQQEEKFSEEVLKNLTAPEENNN